MLWWLCGFCSFTLHSLMHAVGTTSFTHTWPFSETSICYCKMLHCSVVSLSETAIKIEIKVDGYKLNKNWSWWSKFKFYHLEGEEIDIPHRIYFPLQLCFCDTLCLLGVLFTVDEERFHPSNTNVTPTKHKWEHKHNLTWVLHMVTCRSSFDFQVKHTWILIINFTF